MAEVVENTAAEIYGFILLPELRRRNLISVRYYINEVM